MATFKSLTQTETNEHHRRVFEIIAQHESDTEETQDGYKEIGLDSSELQLIRDEMYANVQENLGPTQSATQMRETLVKDYGALIEQKQQEAAARRELAKNKGIVQDGWENPVSGIGSIIDPGMQTEAFIPVSISPTEATAYYANKGVPARIIDKKAGVLSLDGVQFECDAYTPEDLEKLATHAEKCGFNKAYNKGITQALIFGGAVVYPVIEGDNPISTQKDKKQLLKGLKKDSGFIKYWTVADRWNCVFTPNYNITAQDYLYAKSLFIPLGGVRVSTDRMALIRPTDLPFWGAIQQMGWSTSDFEGWIKDYESYQIMKMSLPIMAQQCSLMYHTFPADGLIIENGPDYARKFMRENEEEMRGWSMLHPKAVNSIGEIKILERTYSGFRDLISESRLALCAGCGIPESVLFAEKATGLASDNRDDIELKQSEMVRLLFDNIAPAFQNCIELLVADCFGRNSEQYTHAKEVRIKADDGVVLSDQDKAQLGQSMAQIAGSFVSMGAPLTTSIKAAQKLVKDGDLDEQTVKELTAGEAEGMDQEMWDQMNGGREFAPQGAEFGANPQQEAEFNESDL